MEYSIESNYSVDCLCRINLSTQLIPFQPIVMIDWKIKSISENNINIADERDFSPYSFSV